ncbi:S24 family peptidase [Janthinobacterium sp. PC23-8]|uniref:S24 family peptidase n=1 Tax=Janthinobacterium sp. PC23-8 TaxID=2012679 RepID=UPI000B97A537|nr:S24 family peptidase [Janthinobacterium sp. PC23-8]OYO27903.1 hypothetical protein CD932_22590 [Janthinobacterium sp. PC23-8]
MKIWTTEQEAERLKGRFSTVNRAAFVREHKLRGGQSMIYQHINGLRPISLDAALVYARGFGCSLEEISPRLAEEAIIAASHTAPSERRQSIRDDVEDAPTITGQIKGIPIVGRVQAGPDGTISIDDYGYSDGHMMWYASSPDAYALRIRGESMSPRYLPGEIVGVDPSVEVQSNDEAIVILRDGRRMIKRLLWCRDGQACFESVNKDFPNIILDFEEIDKMHLVSGHIPKAAFRPD